MVGWEVRTCTVVGGRVVDEMGWISPTHTHIHAHTQTLQKAVDVLR